MPSMASTSSCKCSENKTSSKINRPLSYVKQGVCYSYEEETMLKIMVIVTAQTYRTRISTVTSLLKSGNLMAKCCRVYRLD